jgi:hypothetical protein
VESPRDDECEPYPEVVNLEQFRSRESEDGDSDELGHSDSRKDLCPINSQKIYIT